MLRPKNKTMNAEQDGSTTSICRIPESSCKCMIDDVGAEVSPEWIGKMLSVPGKFVPRIEVVRRKNTLYKVLVDYVYHHGVDVDEYIPPEPEGKEKVSAVLPVAEKKEENSSTVAQTAPVHVEEEEKSQIEGRSMDDASTLVENTRCDTDDIEVSDPPVPVQDADLKQVGNKTSTHPICAAQTGSRTNVDDSGKKPLSGNHTAPANGANAKTNSSESQDAEDMRMYEESLVKSVERMDALNDRHYPGVLSTLTGSIRHRPPRPTPSEGKLEPRDSTAPKYSFGLGYAKISHNGNLIIARNQRRTDEDNRALIMYANTPVALKDFCKHAKQWHYERNKAPPYKAPPKSRKYTLHLLQVDKDGNARWKLVGRKDSRSLESIVLREGQREMIIADFKDFQSKTTRKWYMDHGLPHRRCYMFCGPPGVGKTSTIRALAGEMGLMACFLSLSDDHFQNKTLQQAVMNLPKPGMLIIEDIDVLFNERRKSETRSLVSFSGLLNALDGLVSADGVLTVMTTNHPERLDPALTRAGRVDRRFEFKAPNRTQMKNYFLSFYPDADEAVAQKFSDLVFARPEKEARSIATVQEHFIYTRGKTAEESVAAVDEFFEEYYPHSKNDSVPSYTT